MCVQFASNLRVLTCEGRLAAVWFHPANELCFGHKTGIRAAISRAMGMHVGISDYIFLTGTGSYALEAKHGRGSLTANQTDFRAWCQAQGVAFTVFRTVDEGLDALRGWGLLT